MLTLCQPRLASIALGLLVCVGLSRDSVSLFADESAFRQSAVHKRPSLDQARDWLGIPQWIARGGGDGRNVVVAVIDTGFSLRHPALRTRSYTYYDLVPNEPVARQLESTQVQRWLAQGETQSVPVDTLGHGTLIASMVAGQNPDDSQFDGIAPGASLLLIRAGSATSIDDTQWTRAINLALDAVPPQQPLVLLSTAVGIGGTHDATTLPRLRQRPHTALVVAAGNHGNALTHQRVHLPRGTPMRVNFQPTVAEQASTTFTLVHEEPLSFYLKFPDGTRTRDFTSNDQRGATHNGWTFGVDASATPVTIEQRQQALTLNQVPHAVTLTLARAAVAVSPDDQWSLILNGSSVVDLFSSAGEVAFTEGDNEMTLGDVATLEESIAVTALATRDGWPGTNGEIRQQIERDSDGVALFSSRGPDRVHHVRPELSAPGGWIIGALSLEADRSLPGSPIATITRRTRNPLYVATAGTSVAAPIAAGAIARVWSSNPSLSRDAVVSLLTASNPQWSPNTGWGPIDLRTEFAGIHEPAQECSLVAARAHILPGQPLEFALRVRSQGRSLQQPITPELSTTDGTILSVTPLDGGRTRIRWRASNNTPTRSVSIRATVAPQVSCTATIAITDERPTSTLAASCSVTKNGIFADKTNITHRLLSIFWIAMGALGWRSKRRALSRPERVARW